MKFGTELQAHLTPEWRQQYIEYEASLYCIFLNLIVRESDFPQN